MIIYNGFSQTPTRNFTAAGIDFFVPNIKDNDERAPIALEAFKKSFKIDDETIKRFEKILHDKMDYTNNNLNIIHLYYALKSKKLYDIRKMYGGEFGEMAAISYFIDNILTFDKNMNPGIKTEFGDMLFINSGIKIALKPTTCLEFKNKSGKGTKGWTVKACLVDEDYSGYMHLSMQNLWYDEEEGTVYCGDKLTQGVVYETLTDDAIEVSAEEYAKYMENSKRGADGFGSSDVKH